VSTTQEQDDRRALAEPDDAPPAAPGDGRGAALRLGPWFRPERSRLAASFAVGTISVVLATIGPDLLGNATNVLFAGVAGQSFPAGQSKAQVIAGLRAHGQGQLADLFNSVNFIPGVGLDLAGLGRILGLAAAIYALSFVFSWLQSYLMAGVVTRIVFRLRQAVAEKLERLPLRYLDSHPHGDILSRVTNDIDIMLTGLQEGLTPLLTSVITVLGVLGMMFWLSPLLAVVSLATMAVSIVAAGAVARRSDVLYDAERAGTGRLNGLVEETHTGHALVRAFGQGDAMIDEFGRRNGALFQASLRAQFLSGVVLPVVSFVANLNFVLIAALGGFQVASGALSLGTVQAFIQYSRRFSIPLLQIAGQLNLIQSGLASARRVFEFLDAPEEAAVLEGAASPTVPVPVAGAIQFRHVSFRYDPDRPLIEDLTLDVSPGQTVAIVGPTGAGKTTLINLLMRFYEVDSGHILLDGVDYRDLGRDAVRRCFGMVLQDTWLFAGTIWDNIAYGREGACDEDIVAAARAAHADDFIRTLPDGYATVLDGDAAALSSGQKQLLTIARAFLADPGILILDEATSNVDTRTEQMIQDAMAHLRSGRTSFVIAHRLSTVRDAATIVVLDAGRVVEQGTHEDLLARRGQYHTLYNTQFAPEFI
jgi:ATP-binding cassette subfamily B protein